MKLEHSMNFNGFDFSPYLEARPQRRIMPEVDITTQSIPSVQGAKLSSIKLKPLEIPVELRLKAKKTEDISSLRRMLAPLFYVEEPAPLYLSDEPGIHYLVMVKDIGALSHLWYAERTTVTFIALDPIAYGEEHTKSFSFANMRANSSNKFIRDTGFTFDVGGNYSTYPKIALALEINKPPNIQINPAIAELTICGITIAPLLPMEDGTTLSIDYKAQLVEINGVDSTKYVAIDTDFQPFYSSPIYGSVNLVDFEGCVNDDGTSSGVTFGVSGEVTWSERWL